MELSIIDIATRIYALSLEIESLLTEKEKTESKDETHEDTTD